MASAALGAAIGGLVLLVTVAVFAAVLNTYIIEAAQGLRKAAETVSYLSSASLRLVNMTVNGSTVTGLIVNTGGAPVTISGGAVIVVRYMAQGTSRLEVLAYPDGWHVDYIATGSVASPVKPGEAVTLEPGSSAHFVASLEAAPDPSTVVVVVFSSPEGVTARGTCSA